MCILYLEHVSIWISHTSVAMCGCTIGHVVTRWNNDRLKNWRGISWVQRSLSLGEQVLVAARAGRWGHWFPASWLSWRALILVGKDSRKTGILGLGMGPEWESSCFLVRMSQVPCHTSLEEGRTSRPYSDGAPHGGLALIDSGTGWSGICRLKMFSAWEVQGDSVKMKAREGFQAQIPSQSVRNIK